MHRMIRLWHSQGPYTTSMAIRMAMVQPKLPPQEIASVGIEQWAATPLWPRSRLGQCTMQEVDSYGIDLLIFKRSGRIKAKNFAIDFRFPPTRFYQQGKGGGMTWEETRQIIKNCGAPEKAGPKGPRKNYVIN